MQGLSILFSAFSSILHKEPEFVFLFNVMNKNKHNAELQRTDPVTTVTGEFSTRGRILAPNLSSPSF